MHSQPFDLFLTNTSIYTYFLQDLRQQLQKNCHKKIENSCLFRFAHGVNVYLKHIGFGSKKGTSLLAFFEFFFG